MPFPTPDCSAIESQNGCIVEGLVADTERSITSTPIFQTIVTTQTVVGVLQVWLRKRGKHIKSA